MLIGIPRILSPELLKVLMEMGHGDEIVLADANFPAASVAQRLIRCDGHPIPELLEAILQLMPMDTYAEHPAALMEVVPGDPVETPIWQRYQELMEGPLGGSPSFEKLERFAFYERARGAYAVIATGESAQYANLILKKGVIRAQSHK
ncbi:Le51 [Paenibacillus mucilaginosus 3016]|uniref:Le51 n=2 Tax=Paenibacillus mucilaginosus TaxID=61624 RepID=H6NDH4_9BACL|nr:RbsD/FucU domain-containing protein [Paenibacillus mucilaginosus]AFC31314.1 Le51 [Paenibacillus mucilaginosus 3016]AFH63646.1 fucose isomerase [Paenibacillus mucilaginosus K02]WFA19880.1 fucose isomerase [Paenibacillus mucilaginosus]